MLFLRSPSAWSKDACLCIPRENQLEDATDDELDALALEDGEEGRTIDAVERSSKTKEDLDTHTKRPLGRIVDPGQLLFSAHRRMSCVNTDVTCLATLSIILAQVHLPPRTIDSEYLGLVPLAPFQMGILKEHAITACLFFGSLGTGKTLVRALAKEAGCRMLMVSPSDVMDITSLLMVFFMPFLIICLT